MYRLLTGLLFLFTFCVNAGAQIFPRGGSLLSYRRIGFSVPVKKQAVKYKFEIAVGNFDGLDSFNKHVTVTANSGLSRIILEVPAFGKQYTWRVNSVDKTGNVEIGELMHFTIGWVPEIDTSHLHLRILKPALKYQDAYVFVDGHKTLYNMKGEPVWYLPKSDRLTGKSDVRDLKVSPQGTITTLKNEKAIEINYNGDSLWQAPNGGKVSGDTVERYHHEFTRLANGHYMILGSEYMFWEHMYGPGGDTAGQTRNPDGGNLPQKKKLNPKIDFGTIIEYDQDGKVVWSWKSSGYFMNSDLVNYRPEHKTRIIDVHENAFFFDEKDSVIYISYKNISRILKVKYPSGELLHAYGEIFHPGVTPVGNGLFCDQHAVKYSPKGYIYLYNNNACNDSTALPTVVLMKETRNGGLEKIWEYQCSAEGVNINPSIKSLKERQAMLEKNHMKARLNRGALLRSTSGGNVIELPDGSIFVCMNTQYSKMFIVSRNKKLLWSAVPERYNTNKNEWFITPQQYRASIITGKQLDKMIWDSQK